MDFARAREWIARQNRAAANNADGHQEERPRVGYWLALALQNQERQAAHRQA